MSTPEQNVPDPSQTDLLVPVESGDQVIEPEPVSEPVSTQLDPDPEEVSWLNPQLRGKSTAEVEAYVGLLEGTVRGQTRQLNDAARAPASAPEPVSNVPSGDFFDNPREILQYELRQAVKPLQDEIDNIKAQAGVNDAWGITAAKYSDFEEYRPYIVQLIKQGNVSPDMVTPELIESYYYTAYGYVEKQKAMMATQGQPTRQGQPQPQQRQAPPVQRQNIPQHRPSAAPLATDVSAPQPRQLTEEERRLAREFNMTPEEYIAWGDIADSEVVTTELGDKPND